MGSFSEELKHNVECLKNTKSFFDNAKRLEEEEIIKKTNEIKEKNKVLFNNLNEKITDMRIKITKAYLKKSEYSEFVLKDIAQAIKYLISLLDSEQEVYNCLVVKYKGQQYGYCGLIVDKDYYNGQCYIISKKHISEINEQQKVGKFVTDNDIICLATKDFLLEPIYYDGATYIIPQVDSDNDKIRFYDLQNNPLLLFKNFPFVYDFIDYLIDQKIEMNKKDLKIEEYYQLVDSFVQENKKEEQFILSRDKNEK